MKFQKFTLNLCEPKQREEWLMQLLSRGVPRRSARLVIKADQVSHWIENGGKLSFMVNVDYNSRTDVHFYYITNDTQEISNVSSTGGEGDDT